MKIFHYVFAVALIVFVGSFIILLNNEQSISVGIQDLTNTYSALLTSSLVPRNANYISAKDGKEVTPTSTLNNNNSKVAQKADEARMQKTDIANSGKQVKNVTLTVTEHTGDQEVLLNTGRDDTKRMSENPDNGDSVAIAAHVSESKVLDEVNLKRKISPEVFNKDSPFYGMLFRDEYGLPLKSRPQVVNYEQSKIEWHSWKSFFPDLLVNFQKLDKFNPTLNKTMSTRFASVSFDRTNYTLGEEFQATITSQDEERRPKQFGGDYYRVRLIRKRNNGAIDGIPCKVVDNCDGTYTVTAPLLLEGPLILEVQLVNSVEAIREIVMKTEQLITWKMRFVATLQSGEVVTCNVRLASNRQENR